MSSADHSFDAPGRLRPRGQFLADTVTMAFPVIRSAWWLLAVLLFLLIAALSSWIPARRAAALDPVKALREE